MVADTAVADEVAVDLEVMVVERVVVSVVAMDLPVEVSHLFFARWLHSCNIFS